MRQKVPQNTLNQWVEKCYGGSWSNLRHEVRVKLEKLQKKFGVDRLEITFHLGWTTVRSRDVMTILMRVMNAYVDLEELNQALLEVRAPRIMNSASKGSNKDVGSFSLAHAKVLEECVRAASKEFIMCAEQIILANPY